MPTVVCSHYVFMNKDTRGTIDSRENQPKGKPTCLLASFIILMRVVTLWGKLEQNWIVVL